MNKLTCPRYGFNSRSVGKCNAVSGRCTGEYQSRYTCPLRKDEPATAPAATPK